MSISRMLRLLLVVGLVVGTTYGASAGEASGLPNTGTDDIARLVKDIAVLRCVNALEFTDEQIAALLPALREAREIVEREKAEVRERLIKEKEALLKDEKTVVDSGEILKKAAVRAQRLKVAMEELKLKVIEVLTPQQLIKVQRMMLATPNAGIQTAVPSEVMRRESPNLNVPTVRLRRIGAEQSLEVKPEAMQRRTETDFDTPRRITTRLESKRETAVERLNSALEADKPIQLYGRIMQDEDDEIAFRLQTDVAQKQRVQRGFRVSAFQGRFGFGMSQVQMRGEGLQTGYLDNLIRVLEEKLAASSSLSESR